jgi:hypothetical protein
MYVIDEPTSPKTHTKAGITNALRDGRAYAWRDIRHERV